MAMTIYPFILATKSEKQNPYLMNHERIHLEQEKELFLIPFIVMYYCHSIFLLLKYWNLRLAYLLNIFEIEAYVNGDNLKYLKSRKKFSWRNINSDYKKRTLEAKRNMSDMFAGALINLIIMLVFAVIISLLSK